MIIKTDKKGQEQIQALCDVALKVGGIRNLKEVTEILNTIEIIKGEDNEADR